jgi:hypothetical protein
VSVAAVGTPAGEDYGQRREKGYVGKTMGVMAGGPFGDKVADVAVVAGEDWKGVAERVHASLEKKGPKSATRAPTRSRWSWPSTAAPSTSASWTACTA